MLKNYTFIDLTNRLPGPLAGKILSDLGARVIKVEDQERKDPFLSEMVLTSDRSFEHWYEELNKKKQITRLDFKSPKAKKTIRTLLEGAQGLLISLPTNLKEALGLTDEELKDLPLAVVELKASSAHDQSMHDLNALALSGLLSLHVAHQDNQIMPPPFLPIAGIAFGQQVATQMLANVMLAKDSKSFVKSVSYLYETTEQILSPFWPESLRSQQKTKFLHNGAYPCYCLYRLKDGNYLAVAAVEEKYWSELTQLFSIPLSSAQRFESDPEAFRSVAQTFAKLDAHEIKTRAQNKELCISIVRRIN